MNKANTFVVITTTSNTSGRFWPYSREQHPKQFLDLLGIGKSLLQISYERALEFCHKDQIYVTTRTELSHLVTQQLPDIQPNQVLLEPFRRNSAPPIAYACYKIRQANPDAVIIATPADHAIFGELAFIRDIRTAISFVSNTSKLLALGIKPYKAETRFGYIQYHEDDKHEVIKKVKTFTEKPQKELARLFLDSGDFVWNSGIYVGQIQAMIQVFEKFLPDLAEVFEENKDHFFTKRENSIVHEAYTQCKNTSMSFGVLEKEDNVYVLFGKFGWSALNSWTGLHEIREKDALNNIVEGNAIVHDSKNCFIKGTGEKLIVVQNLEGYLVADCDNVLLICPKEMEDHLRTFINEAKANKGGNYI